MKIKLTPSRVYKLSPLALALFCFSVAATEYTATVQDDVVGDPSVQIGSSSQRLKIGINNVTDSSPGKEFSISTQDNGTIDVYANTHALQVARSGNKVVVGSDNTSALKFNTQYISGDTYPNTSYVTGVNALLGGDFSLNAKDINIDVNGSDNFEARGLSIGQSDKGYDTVATIGSANTENITINANGNSLSMGVFSLKANTTLQAKNITINTNGGYGVLVQNNTQTKIAPEDTSRLVINGNNTVINAKNGAGLMAFSNGYLEVNGNLTVNALNAIDARGYATVNVNKDKNATVVLNGDIAFETPGPKANSGDIIDAYVNVNLTGEESSWTGAVYKLYITEQADNENLTKVENFRLSLTDGAQWNATVIDKSQAPDGGVMDVAAVNTLELNDGIINANHGAEQTVEIENLTGSGGQINLLATTDGDNVDSASVVIGTAAEDTHLTVAARGITADDISDVDAAMASLNEKVLVSNTSTVTKQNVIAQGDVIGAITQDVNAAGETSVVRVAENTKLASFKAVNAAAIAAWRDEVAYTNQHLDFLRDNDHSYGVWAQVYGGESTFDDADMDLTSTTVQVGFDTLLGGWVTGVAASYMEGDADMSNGSADVDGYTFALYTERRFDNGFFVNGIARYGRLSTDATADNMSASYDNDAFSIGANGGYRFTFAKYGFIEPSIGLQYAFVKGDDFTSSNHVKVEQDDYSALIGDIGARIGFDFADNMGKLYARAYLNHDFDGDLDGKAYNEKAVAAMESDLGGTWVTYGIGTQVNFTDNFTVFANFDRSTGNEVDTDYMLNAGLRYTF
ncbi:autotransporter outer membrane beta-barrel domain-containing protein [Succinatimonas hippei]|uniref:autotransporter outer membrane beta-barrel domain-containing protein n=1 Tax=Succinatimonas hippei TaxID=626938 RepID=UPI0026F2059D|nr:autotransporter outer membrane beta-barrel domain-containing protein [Succinatimonas hippei]